MLFTDIVDRLNAKVLHADEKSRDYVTACATDMLSEILALGTEGSVLVTGLCTPQLMSTADIVGIGAVVVVRGKNVPLDTIKKAKELDIPLAVTNLTMFSACGVLFESGMRDINGEG